jgi:hypothetical protein
MQSLLILAAGPGSRYGGLKEIDPVDGIRELIRNGEYPERLWT